MSVVVPEERGGLGNDKDVITMIDWNSETWGNRVHLCSYGSWVPDRHDADRAPRED